MRFPFLRSAVALAAPLALLGGNARAELIYGVTTDVSPLLVSFDSATPGSLTTIGAISGLVAGHTLRAIDFRPSNGLLYAMSRPDTSANAQLYTVDLGTGVLTTVGSGLTLPGTSVTDLSIDFNPAADALRVVTAFGQSYRVNANTGALIARDGDINPSSVFAGVAYTNNVAGATSTTLYAYNFGSNAVGTIGSVGGTPVSPNTGQFFTVGGSGFTAGTPLLGFDISGATGIAYSSLDNFNAPGPNSQLYSVNLGTGAYSLVGGFSTPMFDISVQPVLPAAAIPEPGTLALLATGLLPLLGLVARQKSRRVSLAAHTP